MVYELCILGNQGSSVYYSEHGGSVVDDSLLSKEPTSLFLFTKPGIESVTVAINEVHRDRWINV